MKAKELRKKSEDELLKALQDKRSRIVNLRIDLASGNVNNVREVRQEKKDIAKILTVLEERKSEDANNEKTTEEK